MKFTYERPKDKTIEAYGKTFEIPPKTATLVDNVSQITARISAKESTAAEQAYAMRDGIALFIGEEDAEQIFPKADVPNADIDELSAFWLALNEMSNKNTAAVIERYAPKPKNEIKVSANPKEVSSLPTSVILYGREYLFHSDFREWMRYEELMTDGDVPEWLRGQIAADMIFPPEEHVPLLKDTAEFMQWFYSGGKYPNRDSNDNAAHEAETFLESRLPYRFSCDYPYIYAAFMELYGINLNTVPYLHWWEFKALFAGLHDCKFTEIVGYRMTETGQMSENMKLHYEKMQEIYAIPVSVTEKLRIKEAQRYLYGRGD